MGFEVRSPQTLTCSTSTHPFPSRGVPSSTDVRKNPRVTIDDCSASTEISAWPLATFSVVDTNRRQVSRAGERIGLTYTEFSLLELLFREPGRVVPRAEILEQLWGYPPRRAADLRVVDVYVARLRGKLEPDPRNPELILTVRGIGYASQRMGEFPAVIAS